MLCDGGAWQLAGVKAPVAGEAARRQEADSGHDPVEAAAAMDSHAVTAGQAMQVGSRRRGGMVVACGRMAGRRDGSAVTTADNSSGEVTFEPTLIVSPLWCRLR